MALLRILLNNPSPHEDRIVPLTANDLPALRLHMHSRLQEMEAYNAVRNLPGLSMWHPESGEYILVTPWRHRRDIISLREISTFYHESNLIQAVFDAADRQGIGAVITSETYEKRRPVFYSNNGMELMETIISYQHERAGDFLDAIENPQQAFLPVSFANPGLLEQVIATDHAAFSWLWRNYPGEFQWWMNQPSVEVWAGIIEGRVASYYGVTYYQQLGHLDRIGVHPDFQGRGLGREALTIALQRMANKGLQRAALSTQLGNEASQSLYESVGFRRETKNDYQMYGTLLSAAPQELEQE